VSGLSLLRVLRAIAGADRRRQREQRREERWRQRQGQPDLDRDRTIPAEDVDDLEEMIEADMILDLPCGGTIQEVRGWIPEARCGGAPGPPAVGARS
jgi:hypothetical protein